MISVVIPTHGQQILWLALESLARQVEAPPWELIIVEDEIDYGAKEVAQDYYRAMEQAGCLGITALFLPHRTPLSLKWKEGAAAMNPQSLGMMLQADDDYSHPERIRLSHSSLESFDWMHQRRGHFYHLFKKRSIVFDRGESKPDNRSTGVGIAIRREHVENLPDEPRWSGVDSWLWQHMWKTKAEPHVLIDESEAYKRGFFTDGLNRVSRSRREFYSGEAREPFRERDTLRIQDHIPADIFERINAMKKP